MSSDRKRNKRGHHVSVSGDPAEETLNDLVAQFSDPTAFVRELIQNSLDAGASRIEVRMDYRDRMLVVEVIDDGEGMDRATIEGYLLTLFRSTKENDLTKIGKFGIGFVSLFAMGPSQVVVDTGRDAVWHRVIFGEDRGYTLLEMPDPFEGTTVRLELPRDPAAARQDCERIRASAVRWCGFVEADINTSASGIEGGWDAHPIARPFSVEAPVSITERADGFEAVLGPSRAPSVGFYNHGLTLWEHDVVLIPGVSFRVKGRHLEHTLTRDNVIRDRHFDEVMKRLVALAEGKLGAAIHAALAEADPVRAREIFAAIPHTHAWTWDQRAPLIPRADGRRASIADLGGTRGWIRNLWGTKRELLWAPLGDEVAAVVEAGGTLVIAASSPEDAHLRYAAELIGAVVARVHERYRAPRPVPEDPERRRRFDAANAAGKRLGLSFVLHPARLLGAPRFAVAQREPYQLEPVRTDGVEVGQHLLVDVEHELWGKLAVLPPELAGPLLLRAAIVGAGLQTGPVGRELLDMLT